MNKNTITVRELIEELSKENPNAEVMFGGDHSLSFYRVKERGEDLVQIEFSELVCNGTITDLLKDEE